MPASLKLLASLLGMKSGATAKEKWSRRQSTGKNSGLAAKYLNVVHKSLGNMAFDVPIPNNHS